MTLQAVNTARRTGVAVETQQKFAAATNKQKGTTLNTAKLDQETEELKHDHVSLDVSKLIQQGRQAKGLSQKELATVSKSKNINILSGVGLIFDYFGLTHIPIPLHLTENQRKAPDYY